MPSSSNGSSKKAFQRLPKTVVPTHYEIFLRPNLIDLVFKGTIKVNLDVREKTNTLICNAAELEIEKVEVNGEAVEKSVLDESDETLTISLGKELSEGTKATMFCAFTGTLNDRMKGFYRSKYTLEGEERFAATTQFEATDARRAFPCWDEPALKATFDINISAPKNRIVLSNMPMLKETSDSEDPIAYRVCHFDTTPKMSTYLVAFVVGEYEAVEAKSKDGIIVRCYTPMGKTAQGQFALDTSVRAIDYYKDFFGVAYPLSKYDCIAIADFEMG